MLLDVCYRCRFLTFSFLSVLIQNYKQCHVQFIIARFLVPIAKSLQNTSFDDEINGWNRPPQVLFGGGEERGLLHVPFSFLNDWCLSRLILLCHLHFAISAENVGHLFGFKILMFNLPISLRLLPHTHRKSSFGTPRYVKRNIAINNTLFSQQVEVQHFNPLCPDLSNKT